MRRRPLSMIATALAVAVIAAPALADPPGHRGRDRDRGEDRGGGVSISVRIGGDDRALIRDYFGRQFAGGSCPPGLAKKGNGCMPPGQARKWRVGSPLPRDLIFHALPRDLETRLRVPAGARYVRAGADVLLVTLATGLVLDAIDDLLDG